MKRLYYFIRSYSNGLVFLLLEIFALQLIFNPRLAFITDRLNSSQPIAGGFYTWFHQLRSPLSSSLLAENAKLHEALLASKPLQSFPTPIEANSDRTVTIIPAAVLNNAIIYTKNYITLNVGSLSGIEPGMGVFNSQGLVGIVKHVSANFSTVVPLLHTDALFSAKVIPSGAVGTLHWKGDNPNQAQLSYIPSHIRLSVGDSVVTSGYGTAFYEGIPVGIIRQLSRPASGSFYEVGIDLHTNFNTLSYVYVITNRLRKEQDSLEQVTRSYYE